MSAVPHTPLRDVASIERNIIEPAQIVAGTNYVGLENIESGGRFVGVRPVHNGELASSKFAFTPHHVLYGKLRPYLAKIARPDFEGICSTDILPILPGPDLDRGYLAWMLLSPALVAFASSRATGANLPRLSPHVLGGIKIPLPPLPEQRRIATILDQADALRAKRRAALAKLDELTQSIFLDMFGDPATNPKRFPIRALAEFYVNAVDGTKCGPFGSALKKDELVSQGVPVWNMDNIALDGRMAMPFRTWVAERTYNRLRAYAVNDGDIIISRAGTVGKMCVVAAGERRSIISTNLIRVRLGPDLLPRYVVSLMTYCKGRVGRLKTGPDGAFTHMNTGVLDRLRFPYPPMELQRKFVARFDAIEQQKKSVAANLETFDRLFTSLQGRAFRCEL